VAFKRISKVAFFLHLLDNASQFCLPINGRISNLDNQANTKICDLTFTKDSAAILNDAVKNHYWYQMYIGERLCFLF